MKWHGHDVLPLDGDHDAEDALVDQAGGGRPELSGKDAIGRAGDPAALDVTESGEPGLDAERLLELRCEGAAVGDRLVVLLYVKDAGRVRKPGQAAARYAWGR